MDIIKVGIEVWDTINISINWFALLIIILAVVMVSFIIKKVCAKIGRHSLEINEASLGIGSSSVVIRFNKKDQEIAYKLWVELSTRKIGIMFDEKYDVISEVYNSWYEFFKIARELLKDIPVERLPYSCELVELTQKVLNEGLRPHLTKWQAQYRKWYDEAEKEKGTPQEIQKKYPDYELLIEDLRITNEKMIEYKNLMHEIAFAKIKK